MPEDTITKIDDSSWSKTQVTTTTSQFTAADITAKIDRLRAEIVDKQNRWDNNKAHDPEILQWQGEIDSLHSELLDGVGAGSADAQTAIDAGY